MELANQSTGELIEYEPVSPVELEYLIRTLGDRLEAAVPVLKQLWRDRYDAERELIRARAQAVIDSSAPSVTVKRAEADLLTMPQREAFDAAKEILHASEELQKALTARLYGLLNINKVLASAYNASGRH